MVYVFDTTFCINIFDTQRFLGLINAIIRQRNSVQLLVYGEILPCFKLSGNLRKLLVESTCSAGITRYDERRSRFVNKDRINLVDNSVIVVALRKISFGV